ncbi:hypothetical protein IE53DRAFT_364969 [Violaceomyces palustris]|uniref:Uncharacterized protein n=1 Tax=Violaceomyces palustris TaxID=1673888 RepID=A0ACD0NMH0_9BASI|nr:hypothetical protein IE53DRAFT_364969 [Violaceomyces palustris]
MSPLGLNIHTTVACRPASPSPSSKALRILLVDDNHINLSILSTLLKRRFSHVLAKAPVSLDSGLKAIQLLRIEIFDLIFMDIEMPYLNGVECTRRIRSAEDGILEANSSAHIVAVTTAVGEEPSRLYRKVGMDGIISKPVRFEQFQQYLYPLANQAQEARQSVSPITVLDRDMMPPLPPVTVKDRVFFEPEDPSEFEGRSPICSGHKGTFAELLKAQTRESLRDRRAMCLARTGTVSLRCAASPTNGNRKSDDTCATQGAAKLSICERRFQAQVDEEALKAESASSGRASPMARPPNHHRRSSPAFLQEPISLRSSEAKCAYPNTTTMAEVEVQCRPGFHAPTPLRGSCSMSRSMKVNTPDASDGSISSRSSRGGLSPAVSGYSQDMTGSASAITSPPMSPYSDLSLVSNGEKSGAGSRGQKLVYSPCKDDIQAAALRSMAPFDHGSDTPLVKTPEDPTESTLFEGYFADRFYGQRFEPSELADTLHKLELREVAVIPGKNADHKVHHGPPARGGL